MRTFTTMLTGLVFLGVLIPASPSGEPQSRLIGYLVIDYPSISPNGDGIKDWSPVKIRLTEPCDTLSVTLEETETAQVIDTLLFTAGADSGAYTAVWNGEDSLGAPLDEGTYRITLHAGNTDTTEYHHRTVIVDVTAPAVKLDRIEPGIYTPAVQGSAEKVYIFVTISDCGPEDSIEVTLVDPAGKPKRLPFELAGDGNYTLEWADESASDGFHAISMHMYDSAGNTSSDEGFIEVDAAGPAVGFIDPLSGKMENVPPFVEGYCHDRNGVGEPLLSLDGETEFFDPDSTYWRGDTLVWRYGISDTVTAADSVEVDYTLGIRCADTFGQLSQAEMSFTIDRKAPDAPVLTPPDSPVYDPQVKISVKVDYPDADSIVIYRVFADDTTISGKSVTWPSFSLTVPLMEGFPYYSMSAGTPPEPPLLPNYIWTEVLDALEHRSDPSNTVSVVYDNRTGFFIPEVFRGPDAFRVMTRADAHWSEVNIFTLTGENVKTIKSWGPATSFDLAWDLTNDDGEDVRNGAYLAVVTVQYYESKSIKKYFIAVVR